MRIKRTLPLLLSVVAIAAAVFFLVQLRKHAPPEPARLLPAADGFFYVNLKWVRTFNAAPLPPVSHDPDYERFIQETGFQFERDLDQAAIAVHYPVSWNGGTGGSASEPRFSEVFAGRIDAERLAAYLKKLSASADDYHGTEIFNIPLQGRTLRVAILSVDSVAASNHDDPNVIRGIVDRSRKLASPFAGPAFLRHYYNRIPLASLAWAIVRVEPAQPSIFPSASLVLQKPAVLAVSARYLTALHLRAEAFTAGDDEARALFERLQALLTMAQAAALDVQTSAAGVPDSGSTQDLKRFVDSAKVERDSERVTLTAALSPSLIKRVLSESGPEAAAPPPAPIPSR